MCNDLKNELQQKTRLTLFFFCVSCSAGVYLYDKKKWIENMNELKNNELKNNFQIVFLQLTLKT